MDIKRRIRILPLLAVLFFAPTAAAAGAELVPVGEAVGIVLDVKGVYVEELAPFRGETGRVSPAEAAGLLPGDLLVKVDGTEISGTEELAALLREKAGNQIPAEIQRNGKRMTLAVTPEKDAESGETRLGILARETQSGIGTVTWYDPATGAYGALGHGIRAARSEPGGLDRGELYRVTLTGLDKGARGKAGELKGSLSGDPVGTAEANTPYGVFGYARDVFGGETVETASRGEIRAGKAAILSTLAEGGPERYEIEILGVENGGDPGRAISFRVVDGRLLEKTGGVIRGMSGSPILQDGKLVGAVTHVLLEDPARGYGVPIETMLDSFEASRKPAERKAA
ncbi:MAG: PDZ domain-containing protein [Clostridia bacterium]|nr:PDZ domain-containing protein [Clostridia bacterium]